MRTAEHAGAAAAYDNQQLMRTLSRCRADFLRMLSARLALNKDAKRYRATMHRSRPTRRKISYAATPCGGRCWRLTGHVQSTFCDASSLDRKLNFSGGIRGSCSARRTSRRARRPRPDRQSAGGRRVVPARSLPATFEAPPLRPAFRLYSQSLDVLLVMLQKTFYEGWNCYFSPAILNCSRSFHFPRLRFSSCVSVSALCSLLCPSIFPLLHLSFPMLLHFNAPVK